MKGTHYSFTTFNKWEPHGKFEKYEKAQKEKLTTKSIIYLFLLFFLYIDRYRYR